MLLRTVVLFTALATGNSTNAQAPSPDNMSPTQQDPAENLSMIMDASISQDLIDQLQAVADCETPQELLALSELQPAWQDLLDLPSCDLDKELPEIRFQARHRMEALKALQSGSYSLVEPSGGPLTAEEMARMAPAGEQRDGAAQMVKRLANYSADHASVGGTAGMVTGYVGAQALMTWVWGYLTPAVAIGAAGGTSTVIAGVTIVALHGPALAAGTGFLVIWHGTTAVGAIPSATVALGGWCEKQVQRWFPNMPDRLSTDGAQRTALLFVPIAHKTLSGMVAGTALGNCLEGLCRRRVIRPVIACTGRTPDEYVSASPNPIFRKSVEGCLGGLMSLSGRCCGRHD